MNQNPLKLLVGAVFALSCPLTADTLPVLTEKPYLGRWVGYEEKDFDFSIAAKNFHGEIFLKQKSRDGMKRITEFRVIKLQYVLEEEVGGKWQRRSVEPDGFETTQAASIEVEKFAVIASYKGGTKVKVTHELDGEEIMVSTEILETESKNKLRAGVEVVFPDLYRLKKDPEERELKKMMKGDEVVAKTSKGKKLKFELYEDVNLESEKALAEGALEFSLESQNLAKKTIVMTSEVAKTGKIFFRQKSTLHQGFGAVWYPESVTDGKPTPRLVIEIE